MDVWYTAGAGHGADVLPASSKTQPALPDMLPSCDVDVSPLTGLRAWALGKTSLPGSRSKVFLWFRGLWTPLSGFADSSFSGGFKERNHGSRIFEQEGTLASIVIGISHCNDES